MNIQISWYCLLFLYRNGDMISRFCVKRKIYNDVKNNRLLANKTEEKKACECIYLQILWVFQLTMFVISLTDMGTIRIRNFHWARYAKHGKK